MDEPIPSARRVEWVPDIAIIFDYAWAGLMFLSAALNLIAAMSFSVMAWSAFMSVWAVASKVGSRRA